MHSHRPSIWTRSSLDCSRSPSGGAGVSVFSQGSMARYWAKACVRSGTRSFTTATCGKGVIRTAPFTSLIGLRQASVFTPSMLMAQEPQIPSRQERRNVSVESISFLMVISASSTIGPQASRSNLDRGPGVAARA
jgi:hypothetical protein